MKKRQAKLQGITIGIMERFVEKRAPPSAELSLSGWVSGGII
jgi:hypothetical protein